MARKRYVNTVWELWSYDVWGNETDGYEVNDRSCFARQYKLRLAVVVNNEGTPQEFISAYPKDNQIRRAFGCKRVQLDLEGDDTYIYVSDETTGYPIGEMICTSHESLSPIRE
jgi:hypothetical protein